MLSQWVLEMLARTAAFRHTLAHGCGTVPVCAVESFFWTFTRSRKFGPSFCIKLRKADLLSSRYAVVVTSINAPTRAVLELQRDAHRLNAQFVIIGDSKSPADFHVSGATYLDLAAQQRSGFRFAALCPNRHYARKNIGYLVAAKAGADVILETDDDNIPNPEFWAPRERFQTGQLVQGGGWCNVYRYFTEALIWPRGLPLDHIHTEPAALSKLAVVQADCPIQQGLADGNPDVDAIYRLVLPLPLSFERGRTLILGEGAWCPFNSQNTTFWREAFPLLYLPYHCSFRMTDIWRSFVAQRLAWTAGWHVQFGEATVYQERNEHDLMRDFAEEVPGYLHNERIRKTLEDTEFQSGAGSLLDNLLTAYEALIGLAVVGAEERPLIQAWVDDYGGL